MNHVSCNECCVEACVLGEWVKLGIICLFLVCTCCGLLTGPLLCACEAFCCVYRMVFGRPAEVESDPADETLAASACPC